MNNRMLVSACMAVMMMLGVSWDAKAIEPVALSADQANLVQIARAQSLPSWLSTADRQLVTRAAEAHRVGKTEEASALWLKVVQANGRAHSADELAAVSRWVLRNGLLARQPVLLQKATQTAQSQDLRSDLRAYVTLLKAMLAAFPPLPANTVAVPLKVVSAGRLLDKGVQPMTREALQALIASMEAHLAKATESSNLHSMELQNVYQNYQQAVQTIANIQKQVHDDAMKIISNLK